MESFLRNVVGSTYEMGAGQSAPGGFGDGAGGSAGAASAGGGHHEQEQQASTGGRGGHWADDLPFFNQPPHPQQQQQPPPVEHTIKPPPASSLAIRQLPTVTVTPQDLVDPNNRECCICFESHSLKDRVVRLPCAHIYHPGCIVDWLKRSCTCPVCRYELPTSDANYEVIRKRKMMARKPRYARYELDRMSARELRHLALGRLRLRLPGQGVGLERTDLIQTILDSGRIEIIAAPEPEGEFTLQELRGMGVGKLRRTMEEAGVFFSKEDVVEKEDMVQIFVKSGRIVVMPIPEEQREDEAEDHQQHEQRYDSDVSMADVSVESIEAEEIEIDNMEAVQKDNDERDNKASTTNEAAACSWSDASSSQNEDNHAAAAAAVSGGAGNNGNNNNYSAPADDVGSPISLFDEQRLAAEAASAAAAESQVRATRFRAQPPPNEYPQQEQAYSINIGEDDIDTAQPLPNVTRQTRIATYADRSVSQLKAIATQRGIDVSDCIEKREIVRRIADDGGYVQA